MNVLDPEKLLEEDLIDMELLDDRVESQESSIAVAPGKTEPYSYPNGGAKSKFICHCCLLLCIVGLNFYNCRDRFL